MIDFRLSFDEFCLLTPIFCTPLFEIETTYWIDSNWLAFIDWNVMNLFGYFQTDLLFAFRLLFVTNGPDSRISPPNGLFSPTSVETKAQQDFVISSMSKKLELQLSHLEKKVSIFIDFVFAFVFVVARHIRHYLW